MTVASPSITASSCYQSLPSCVSGLSLVPLFPSPPPPPSSPSSVSRPRRPAHLAAKLKETSPKIQANASCASVPDQAALSVLASYIVRKLPELAERARVLEREEKQLDRRIKALEGRVGTLGVPAGSPLAGGAEGGGTSRGRKRGADALDGQDAEPSVRFSQPVLVDEDIQLRSGNSDVFLCHTISLRSRRKGRIFFNAEADRIAAEGVKRRRLD
ncbi:hypothetical protein GLOTRDRAFT_128850 [Gloeophyllum trabeum ATCC 11539]|uniref:Uncharacterized protein n=1 Tax=Gloeophyllum trabeum (strain ATCC 11539 / FP-39264 / Madison 617) TaxID=670483 RepID=S7RRN0_GLOTA|nr:uncharacterized protein GLOTRDRAFT_128850 [Gloeophyllum trabeum ATCC 11539]EPQ55629.1 hypothetical protein GLOTRDRAFT_128850 [Gloeophyllum trabeum ATCC 11539]